MRTQQAMSQGGLVGAFVSTRHFAGGLSPHKRPMRITYGGLALTLILVVSLAGFLAVETKPAFAAAGDIETVAGGGSAPQPLTDATGLARVDDTLYVTDSSHHVVFARDLVTGAQSIVVGQYGTPGTTDGPVGSATLRSPVRVAADADHNLYIAVNAHPNDCFIRRFDSTTLTVSTIAGTGPCEYAATDTPTDATTVPISWPAGLVTDAAGDLYFHVHAEIRKLDVDTGLMVTVAGRADAGQIADGVDPNSSWINSPTGMAFGPDGSLFIAEGHNAIRRVSADFSTIETVFGAQPGGGNVGDVDGPAASAATDFSWPTSIDVSAIGEVHFFDGNNNKIKKLSADFSTVTTIAGDGVATNIGDGGPALAASVTSVDDLEFDAAGRLHLAVNGASSTHRVIEGTEIVAGGLAANGDGGPATDAILAMPSDVVRVGRDLYILEADNGNLVGNRIRRMNVDTGIIETIAGNGTQSSTGDGGPARLATFDSPRAMAYDHDGGLLIADSNGTIRRIDLDASPEPTIDRIAGVGVPSFGDGPALSAGFQLGIMGIAVAESPAAGETWRRIYVADTENDRIRCIGCAGEGIVSTIAGTGTQGHSADGTPATAANIISPGRITVAPANAPHAGAVVFGEFCEAFDLIWALMSSDPNVADYDLCGGAVRFIDPTTGQLGTIAGINGDLSGTGDGGPASSASIAVSSALRYDVDGNLYIAELGGSYFELLAVMFGFDQPTRDLFGLGELEPAIRKVDAATGVITTIAGGATMGDSGDGGAATDAAFGMISAIAPDQGTHLYVADLVASRVRRIEGARPDVRFAADPQNNPDTITVGAQGTFTATLRNDGVGTATPPVRVSVSLPAGLAYVSESDVDWLCSANGQVVTCDYDEPLKAGESTSVMLRVRADGSQTGAVQVAFASSSDSDDADPSNQSATVPMTIVEASSPPPSSPPPVIPDPGPVPSPSPGPTPVEGYGLVGEDGGTFGFGASSGFGSLAGSVSVPLVSADRCASALWAASRSGGVFTAGDAGFFGSLGDVVLNEPIVGIHATDACDGYRLVGADGGVFSFGNAPYLGGLGGVPLNAPIVGIAGDGGGYRLVAPDGGVFTFGDAGFHGGLGGLALNSPIVAIVDDPAGDGYWLVAADGGVFAFGGAGFHGSLAGIALRSPIVDLVPTADGGGYVLVAADGGVFAFGGAAFHGSLAGYALSAPVIAGV